MSPGSRGLVLLPLLLLALAAAVAARAEAPVELDKRLVHPTRILVRELGGATRAASPAPALADLGLAARPVSIKSLPGLRILDEASPAKLAPSSAERARVLAKRIATLRASGRYAYVEPDYVVTASALPDDQALADGTLWGLVNTGQNGGSAGADIDAARAWDITTGSASVIVAVIDSGIRYTHQELVSRMWINPDEIPNNGIDDDGDGYIDNIHGIDAVSGDGDPDDDNDHGTHVAGTIGAAANDGHPLVGVAWDVRLMALKFLDADGSGYVSGAIDCIDFAVANGARVLNNSWGGGGYSQALFDSIAAARDAGVLFVAAAGNEASDNDLNPAYPASYALDNIISVAALDRQDQLPTFSNVGATTVHLGAPGVAIYSSSSGSDTEYSTFSGTSMAAPHVAGVAALVLSRFPDISLVELRERLLATTVPVPALQGLSTTGGRVNAHQALVAAADGVLDLTLTAAISAPFAAGREVTFFVGVTDLGPVPSVSLVASGTGVGPITFSNSGLSPDRVADDALHTATVTIPTGATEFTLTVEASAPGKTGATLSRTYAIAQPPANDLFANRSGLVGTTASATGSNLGAGIESDEPVHAGAPGGRSVWWSWTAPSTGTVTIDTFGSDFDTVLAAYTGASLDSLVHVASNDDRFFDLTSEIVFNTTAGQTYHLVVDGYGGDGGDFELTLALGPPQPAPANDSFGARIPLAGTNVATTGTNLGASSEPGEPVHANIPGDRSVWWTWTALADGVVVLHTEGSSFDTVLGVYLGDSVETLSPVASDDDDGTGLASRVVVNVIAGQHYHIAVDGRYSDTGSVSLNLAYYATPPVPENDTFAARAPLFGSTADATGTTLFATRETAEPTHADNSGGASVWWTWTAPASGPFTIVSAGSAFDTLLAVYTGTTLPSLVEIASNDQDPLGADTSRVTFNAVAGITYQIALDGWNDGFGPDSGEFFLSLAPGDGTTPPNDDFANRIALVGATVSTVGNNLGATKQFGEPDHNDEIGGASVWWSWTAPVSGFVTIDTAGSPFLSILAVYTGSNVSSLVEVGSDLDFTADEGAKVTFRAVANVNYKIAVDGVEFDGFVFTGPIRLRIAPQPAPANDAFANRARLLGYVAEVEADNRAATKQSGEPNHAFDSGGASVWWTWRAPASGTVTLHTEGSDFDTLLAVYIGTSVTNLNLRASNDDGGFDTTSRLTFSALAGRTYEIAVDGFDGDVGDIRLSLSHSAAGSAPLNDAFASRLPLDSPSTSRSNVGATAEPGEPLHAGLNGGTSLWWTWTAPIAGTLTLDTTGSTFDTLLAVYAGHSLATLAPIAANDQDPLGGATSRVVFEVTPGLAYHIAVDGKNFATGTAFLSQNFEAAPVDRFEDFLTRHFNPEQLADPALVGPDRDPDGDGLANLLEYAFALDPLVPDREAPSTLAVTDGHLMLTFLRRTDVTDLAYIPEVSATLAGWQSVGIDIVSVEPAGENLERVTARDTTALAPGARRFMRLRVER